MTGLERSLYAAADYPQGCLCGSCKRPFEDGDDLYHRRIFGGQFWAVLCTACATSGAPLHEDHPAVNGDVTFLADGRIEL